MDDRAQRFHVASRMASIAPFEVMEIQTLARRLEAQGRDVIHLEIGEPDFTTPAPGGGGREARARRAAHVLHLRAGHPGAARGHLALLRRALRRRGCPAERIVVTAGLERGAAARLRRAARRGRRGAARRPGLSLQPPFRARAGRRAAARPGGARTRATSSRRSSPLRAWSPRTRVAMVASPSNPTGHARRRRTRSPRWPRSRARGAQRSWWTRSTTGSPTAATRAPRSRRATTSSSSTASRSTSR